MKNHRFGFNKLQNTLPLEQSTQSANSLICYYVFLVKQPLPCFGVRAALIHLLINIVRLK